MERLLLLREDTQTLGTIDVAFPISYEFIALFQAALLDRGASSEAREQALSVRVSLALSQEGQEWRLCFYRRNLK